MNKFEARLSLVVDALDDLSGDLRDHELDDAADRLDRLRAQIADVAITLSDVDTGSRWSLHAFKGEGLPEVE